MAPSRKPLYGITKTCSPRFSCRDQLGNARLISQTAANQRLTTCRMSTPFLAKAASLGPKQQGGSSICYLLCKHGAMITKADLQLLELPNALANYSCAAVSDVVPFKVHDLHCCFLKLRRQCSNACSSSVKYHQLSHNSFSLYFTYCDITKSNMNFGLRRIRIRLTKTSRLLGT